MEITGIDTDAPVIIDHSRQGNLIIMQISDGDGVGVDYDSITAYTEASGQPVSPAWCNETEETIAFTVPDETILIRISDKNGNYRMLSLSPS